MSIAFLFPGQGTQKVGMGKALADAYSEARQTFEAADDALGESISRLCFEGPEEELALTANGQPAILTVSIAALRVVERRLGVQPAVVAGHSLGEYSALVCAGALRFEDAVRVVRKRGEFMQEAVPVGQGAMAAVMRMSAEAVETLCRDASQGAVLVPANFNSPKQIVVAGAREAVERAVSMASQRGGLAKLLKVSAPFHSPLMEPAAVRLAAELEQIEVAPPRVPVVFNVEAREGKDAGPIRGLLRQQVTSSVRWTESVERMVSLGVDDFLEIGPGRVLSGLIKQLDRKLQTRNIGAPEDLG